MWTLIWLMATVFGRHDGKESTDRLVPAEYKGNPWGPEANAARKAGELPPVIKTAAMKKWDAWGKQVLKDGDILFRLGDARIARGWFPISRFLAKISGSKYSHTGIVAMEDGEVMVYDMTNFGPRVQPLSVWTLDNIGGFGVKRVKPEYAAYIPKALAFLREVYVRQVPFDYDLNPDDSTYYCVELSEKAYRNNGLPLAEPVKLGDMENVSQYPISVMGFLKATPLTLELPVYFPGNMRHGIWSSSKLFTVYESPAPPPAASSTRAANGVKPASTSVPAASASRPVGQNTAAKANRPSRN